MDSSINPTHGEQEGAAWNGHFDCTCYRPNFLFNQFGMLERCALRNGNVHSADGTFSTLSSPATLAATLGVGVFAFPDALLGGAALVAETHHPIWVHRQVGDDEAHPGEQLTGSRQRRGGLLSSCG